MKWQKWYAPGVRSQHDGLVPTPPLSTSVNLVPESADESGEDWMYDITNFINPSTGLKDGYILTGYTAHRNWEVFDIANCGGAIPNGTPDLNDLHCDNPLLQKGHTLANAMRIDEDGNVIWFETYGNHIGEMWDIKQSKVNRNHIYVCGRSNRYENSLYNPSNNTSIGGSHILYPTNDCDPDERKRGRKPAVMKLDASGNVIWEYTYGWEDDPADVPANSSLYSILSASSGGNMVGRFWDMVELDNGEIIVGGCTVIANRDASGNIIASAPTTWMRPFLIKIDANGMLLAKRILEPLATRGSNSVFNGNTSRTYNGGIFAIEIINQNEFVVGFNHYKNLGPVNGDAEAGLFKIDANLNDLVGYEYDNQAHLYNNNNLSSSVNFVAEDGYFLWDILKRESGGSNEIVVSGHSKENPSPTAPVPLSPLYRANRNAEGIVFKTDLSLNLQAQVSIGPVGAYDLMTKMNLNNDQSIAIISSTHAGRINDGISPVSHVNACCNNYVVDPEFTWVYNSDALFGRINSSSFTLDWLNVVKDPMDQGSCYPENFKKQLCMYNVVEADNGDWVACGNNGVNLDDVHIIRMEESCEGAIPNTTFNYLPDDPLLIDPKKSVQQHCINMGYGTNWTIGSDKKWKCQVVVEHGYTLKLGYGSTQEFADIYRTFGQLNNSHYSIIIKSGGKLIIENNVTLTGMIACDGGWGGIKLEDGAEIIMLNSTLKNAFTAIESEGGKILIENSLANRSIIPSIYNCRRGIDVVAGSFSDSIKFKYAYFKNDAPLSYYDKGLDFFVRLEDVDDTPTKFISCKFENSHFTSGTERAAGVLGMRSGMHFVKGGSTTTTYSNPGTQQSCLVPNDPPNEFYGLKKGIWAHNLNVDQPTPVRILECSFDEVVLPITASGCRNALIYGNTITWDDVQTKPILAGPYNKLGVLNTWSWEPRIWENTILNNENYDFKGVYTEQSWLQSQHYKNTINHTGTGNYGTGHQFSLDNEELDIQCEQYTSLQTDWHIKDGLLKEQGDQLPSGFHNTNNWSLVTPTSGNLIISAPASYSSYVYHITNSNPATVFDIRPIDASPTTIINDDPLTSSSNPLACFEKDKCLFYSASSGESNEYDVIAMVQKTPLEQIFDAIQNDEFELAVQQLSTLEINEREFYSTVIPFFKNELIRKEQASVLSHLKGIENLQDRNVQRLAKDYMYFYNGVQTENSSAERRLKEKRSQAEAETASSKKELADLKVYPNPANKTLFIVDQIAHSNVEVYSQTGKRVLTHNPKNEKAYSIDVSQLPSGMYFIDITKIDDTRKILKIAVH